MNIKKYIYNNHWTIGFIDAPLCQILNNDKIEVKWVKNPYKNRWFADPFILDLDNENIYVLVEEFYDPIARGRISKLTIDLKKYTIKTIDVILELPTHLSFPAIMRCNDKIFIYPENSAGNTLKLYEYNPITNECICIETISEESLADAIIFEIDNVKYLFATCSPHHNGNVLNIYQQNDMGVFELKEKKSFNSNIARNAGDYFELDGKFYRPAQDCSTVYGGAVIIQEITRNENGFHFENIKRIDCMPFDYSLGLHTFNYYNGVAVLDANGFRRPKLASFVNFIRRIIKNEYSFLYK